MLWTALLSAQTTAGPPDQAPTFSVTSRLVFLDVTVLDKRGHPVTKGLTKDDFQITESHRPQQIVSFEPPVQHRTQADLPLTIFVLDLLNSRFEDSAFLRLQARKYFNALLNQPNAPAELMVLGNRSLDMVQGSTTSKYDLLSALEHIPAAIPYKLDPVFYPDRLAQSLDALQQIAQQNQGVSGRKNVIWLGHGSPNITTAYLPSSAVTRLDRYVHETANTMVNARVSLFVLYPDLSASQTQTQPGFARFSAFASLGDNDPFSGDVNFGIFAKENGGALIYDRNDLADRMHFLLDIGSEYYTLTYRPDQLHQDGKFQRIRVTVNKPGYTALTEAGYFAPDKSDPVDAHYATMLSLAEAMSSTIPIRTLPVGTRDIVHNLATGALEFTATLKSQNLPWESTLAGQSELRLIVATASLDKNRKMLASRVQPLIAATPITDPGRLATVTTTAPIRSTCHLRPRPFASSRKPNSTMPWG